MMTLERRCRWVRCLETPSVRAGQLYQVGGLAVGVECLRPQHRQLTIAPAPSEIVQPVGSHNAAVRRMDVLEHESHLRLGTNLTVE